MLVTMNGDNVNNAHNGDGHFVGDAALSGEIKSIDAKSADIMEMEKHSSNGVGTISAGIAAVVGRKRKTRRFKSRFKNKLRDDKYKYVVKKMRRARVYPQSEAPYNTNQFLMADHNNMEDLAILDDNAAAATTGSQSSRNRESSFTSVDTDDDEFYSSPEHEQEFLTKDFDDTYQTLCAEKFGNLSKSQLTKIIFELEAKVDELSKKLDSCSRLENTTNSVLSNRVSTIVSTSDANELLVENQTLRLENEGLKRFIKENNIGSVGLRSPSSSSCSSSSSSSSGDSDSVSENEMGNANESRTVEEPQITS